MVEFLGATAVNIDSMGIEDDIVDNAQDGSVLALVHLESSHHSSLSRCLPSSPSRSDMLCNISHHVLLTYIIYNKGWLGYLQSSIGIDSCCLDVL